MAAGAWTFTNTTRANLLNGTFDLDTDTFKCALLTSLSTIGASTTTWSGVTTVTGAEVAAGGYTAGGIAVALVVAGTTSVTVKFNTNPTWTASGGSIVAKYAVIYEVGGNVLCYCLLDGTGANLTVTAGNSLTIDGITTAIFTLA